MTLIRYTHLRTEEGDTLAAVLQQCYSLRAIACTLRRSPAKLSREVARNGPTSQQGHALHPAQQANLQRRQCARPSPKLHPESVLCDMIIPLLRFRWSSPGTANTRLTPARSGLSEVSCAPSLKSKRLLFAKPLGVSFQI